VYPPVFQYAVAHAPVLTALGTNPTRFWPFGKAPQDEPRPYAVHQLVYGTPENTLSCPPDIDLFGIQIDAYAKSVTDARNVAAALRDAFEPHGHVTAWNGENWEANTGLYRVSFTVEFWTLRA
jgi:hypothetical protein